MNQQERVLPFPKEKIQILKRPLSPQALVSRTHAGYMRELDKARREQEGKDK